MLIIRFAGGVSLYTLTCQQWTPSCLRPGRPDVGGQSVTATLQNDPPPYFDTTARRPFSCCNNKQEESRLFLVVKRQILLKSHTQSHDSYRKRHQVSDQMSVNQIQSKCVFFLIRLRFRILTELFSISWRRPEPNFLSVHLISNSAPQISG